MTAAELVYREDVLPTDATAVRAIVDSTGFFSRDEVDVAVELVEERLSLGEAGGYFFLFGEMDGRVVGYTCFGPIPCTAASYDLYWIAVHQEFRGRGIGPLLMARSERLISARGGRRVYIETSSRPQYEPTRSFYLRCGYRQAALLEDFYGPGDGKIIYERTI